MTLRTRLLLGYGYLVALLLATAMLSALGLQRFGRSLDRVLLEDVRRVEAALAVLHALDQHAAAAAALVGGERGAADALRAAGEALERGRAEVAARATEPEELERAAGLAREAAALRAARDRLLSAPTPRAADELEVRRRLQAARGQVLRLLEHDTREMQRAEATARRQAHGFALGLAALVVVALLSLGAMSRGLQRGVLARLDELKGLGDAVAAGDRGRRLRARHDDELGVLARHLNAALDQQEAVAARVEGRLSQQAQLLLGLVGARGGRAAVVGLDGVVIASTLPAAAEARVASFEERIRDERRAVEPGAGPVVRRVADLDGAGGLTLELLVHHGRPAGWLVTVDEAAPRS
ncbi:MAG: hypothetical protein M9894_07475 [Planctomycetes bacterium]|nr:hypothetical protein [Planctomycetota bacterium]